MPLKPHPTDPDKMVYVSRQYDMPDTPTARAYLAKVLEDDDTQVYGDALTIAYQSGYYDGKKAALLPLSIKRPWVGLKDDAEIFAISNTMPYADRFEFARAIEAVLKEKNT